MKKMLTLLVMVMACQLAFSQTHNELFNKYKSAKGANYTEIPKGMLQMAAATQNDAKLKEMMGRLEMIQMLDISKPDEKLRNQIVADTKKLETRYDKLGEEQEDGETTIIYTKGGDGDTFEVIVTLIIQPDGCELIALEGKIKASDLEEIAKLGQ